MGPSGAQRLTIVANNNNNVRRGQLTGQLARRGLWALVVVLVLVGIVASAVPYVASTRIVRDRIALELGWWSGYRVNIGATPRLSVWPRLSAVLEDVTFSEWSKDARPVATAERIDVDLSALAALKGNAVFTAATVVRPTIVLDPGTDALDFLAGKGRLRNAIDQARAAIAADPAKGGVEDGEFGMIAIVDGRIVTGADTEKTLVEDLDVSIDLPRLNSGGSMSASATWNGKRIKGEARSDGPLRLLAGGEASLDVSLDSDPAKGSFQGRLRLGDDPMVDGALAVEARNVGDLLAWMGVRWRGMEALPALAFSAKAVGERDHVAFNEASVVIEGETGTGALEAGLSGGAVSLTGSLAFVTLPLDRLASLLTTTTAGLLDPNLEGLPGLRTDLRISAAHGAAPGFTLDDLAAMIQIKDRQATFDLLDAAAFGGRVGASLRLNDPASDVNVALRIEGRDVDGASLAAAAGTPGLLPSAKGSVLVELEGKGVDLADALLNGRGQAFAHLGAGSLAGIDLAVFLERSASGELFPLSDAQGSDLAIEGLTVDTTLTAGLVRIRKAEAIAAGRRIWLDGLASYRDHGLALSGGIGPVGSSTVADTKTIDDEAKFFIGGSWSAPFVSPIRPVPR